MKKWLIVFTSFLISSTFVSTRTHAATSVYPFTQGKVELLSTPELALHFKLDKDWHIYWKNSGDSGAAPKWNWTIKGAKITGEHWPVPQRIPIAGLINFGYDREALFRFDLEPEAGAKVITANLKLEFLVCKVECIPYFTELQKNIPTSALKKNSNKKISKFIYPTVAPTSLQWKSLERKQDVLVTELQLPPEIKTPKNLEIFPEDGESFKTKAPAIEVLDGKYQIQFALQDTSKNNFAGTKFLLVLEDKGGKKTAWTSELQGSATGTSLALILLWAVLGGIILNFMPCVFPVLSIKVLSFLGPDKQVSDLKKSGVFYTLGVLASFLALGSVLLALRASGEQIGWGFQLQSPLIAAGIAVLFFWLSLNFLGTFEIGQSLSFLGAKKTSHDLWGSFLTGVLATIVATPCTAPFMGAALGASLALAPALTLLVFAGLGFGMALPFLLLAFYPQALRFLPRPGLWMQRLKEFLAFPLLATVVWLLWVLSQQVQTEGLIFVLGLFVLIGFWVWMSHSLRHEKIKPWILAAGFVVSLFALKALPTQAAQANSKATQEAWQNFDEKQIQADIKGGHAVFIDFTAAWCITCQVNKKLVLHTNEISETFTREKVRLYKADWTDRDPEITAALARFGRNSLPLYVFYPAGKSQPQLLPEILTPGIILDLFKKENSL